jgi:PAS domain S-box-containing protein
VQCAVSHPRFVLPILFLMILVILLFAAERRFDADINALQTVLAEEVPLLTQRLREAGVDFHTNKNAIENLYTDIRNNRTGRNVLFVLIILNGLMLFGALLCNARCYSRKAKEAHTAEHYSALFAAALQSTRKGVIIRNMRESGQPVAFVNKAFATLTGYDQILLADKEPDVLFGWHTDKSTVAEIEKSIRQKKSASFDILIYRKDGSSFWSEWHISPIVDGRGDLMHYVTFISDITGFRQTHEALLLAKDQAEHASSVKTNFLATVSHEIRTPLNGLLGVLHLLGDSVLDQDQRRLVDIAADSGRALHEIINDILDYSKIEAGKVKIVPQQFSLREVLQNAIDLARPEADAKNMRISLEFEGDIPDRLISDAGRIRQILLNLLTNAVKYTEQGSVRLRVTHMLSKGGGDQPVALLRFDVIDTGIGISVGDQDRLFQEFSRIENINSRRCTGTGLGLAISKRLVSILNGEIGVESRPGQGSKFWFMLPLPIAEPPEKTAVQIVFPMNSAAAPESGNHRLLLVEDNETNRLVASRYLDKAGYKHDMAATGAEALLKFKAGNYDLILMDLSMPDMDGFEATRQIRMLGGRATTVPIIALTAHVMQGDRERCLAAGMNDHLSKPLDYNIFARTIRIWLEAVMTVPQAGSADGGTSAAPPETPELDASVLQRLVNDLGADSMLRITGVFMDDFSKRKDILKHDGETLVLENIEHAAHTLKSSSANCGLMRFSSYMAALEKTAKEKNREEVRALFHQFDQAYNAAHQALTEARTRYENGSA